MEHICTRCVRLSLGTRAARPSLFRIVNARTFSTSTVSLDDSAGANRSRVGSKSQANATTSSQSTPFTRNHSPGFQIRRVAEPEGGRGPPTLLRRTSQPNRPREGQSQARSQGQTPGATPGVLMRRGEGTGRLRTGNFEGGRFRRDSPGGASGRGSVGKPKGDQRVGRARGRAKEERENESDNDLINIEAQADKYVAECVDRPVNPTEPLDHVPGQNMSIEEFRKDWPNTPLSPTGLTEGVQQRIEFLSHRLPHSYETPMQLVERLRRGKLTRFESEEEKATVLKLAAEVSQTKADEIMEKKGTEVQPKDMSFDDLSSRSAESGALKDAFVRGVYPEVQKQERPFLDQIVRNLQNNQTYNAGQSEEFINFVKGMVPAQQQRQNRT